MTVEELRSALVGVDGGLEVFVRVKCGEENIVGTSQAALTENVDGEGTFTIHGVEDDDEDEEEEEEGEESEDPKEITP